MTNQNNNNGKDPLIHFPFYVNQYQGLLTKFSFVEKGAFIALLCSYISEDGQIPDDSKIYRITGAFTDEERTALSLVKDEVIRIGSEIMKNQKTIREKRRKKARKAAKSRWKNNDAPSNQQAINKQCQNDAITETEKETEKEIKIKLKTYSPEVEELAQDLKLVLELKLNRKLQTNTWKDEIRKLLNDLKNRPDAIGDVKKVINEISSRFGEQYFPIVQSGAALREKFSKIEAAMSRCSNANNQGNAAKSDFAKWKEGR